MKFLNYVVNIQKEKFDYVFDWTTENDIKKRKEEFNLTCPPLDYGDGDKILILNEENNTDENEEILDNNEGDKKKTTKKDTIKKETKKNEENEKSDKDIENEASRACIM